MKYFHDKKIILVNGKETYLLAHWISMHGLILEVSGPQSLRIDEHNITLLDGTPIQSTDELL